MIDLFNYRRRASATVNVGATPLGGEYPIRLQSMTNVPTKDTEACIEQAKRIIAAGGEYVRLTTRDISEAENLRNINAGLRAQGVMTPLVADVHFNPAVADVAARYAEKVRINPGNYVDPGRTFKHIDYTDAEYAAELRKLHDRFVTFLDICRENRTAIRLGVNHGSLSDRIMSRYGDTPEGMVESCMEFLRICVEQRFDDVVISIKASNPSVMVRTVRMLVAKMDDEGMSFPLHLGVTEAGNGEDGRIKSCLGIGALLADGYGDTVRVSLSEAPEREIPVARKLVDYVLSHSSALYIPGQECPDFDYLNPVRRRTHAVGRVGGANAAVVISQCMPGDTYEPGELLPDYIYAGPSLPADRLPGVEYIVDAPAWQGQEATWPAFSFNNLEGITTCKAAVKFLFLPYMTVGDEVIGLLKSDPGIVVISQSNHPNRLGEHRALVHLLWSEGITAPVVFFQQYMESDVEDLQVKASADMGALVFDGLCDGIFIFNHGAVSHAECDSVVYGILQAGRLRISRTDYISCPGCGRTLYDLEGAVARVKAATAGLRGLKIAVMGCIVNGPGEMADADYGYVGAGPGRVNLYRGKECVEHGIAEDEAVARLVELIKANGDWRDA